MDIMKDLPDKCIDLAIVDPPYGICRDGQKENKKGKKSDRKYYKKNHGILKFQIIIFLMI